MGFIGIIRKINDIIGWLEYVIVVFLLASMASLAFLQVLLRNLFSFGFPWADEVLRHAVVWIGLLGASLGIKEERSIRIDIFNRFLPPRPNSLNEAILNFTGALVSVFLVIASVIFLKMEYEYHEVFSTLRIPVWQVLLIYPFSFSVIAFRFIFNGTTHLLRYFRPEQKKEK